MRSYRKSVTGAPWPVKAAPRRCAARRERWHRRCFRQAPSRRIPMAHHPNRRDVGDHRALRALRRVARLRLRRVARRRRGHGRGDDRRLHGVPAYEPALRAPAHRHVPLRRPHAAWRRPPACTWRATAFHFGICAVWGIVFALAATLLRADKSFGGALVLGVVIGLAEPDHRHQPGHARLAERAAGARTCGRRRCRRPTAGSATSASALAFVVAPLVFRRLWIRWSGRGDVLECERSRASP